jgi:hypothetical protein
MEIATDENEQAVAQAYGKAVAAICAEQPLSADVRLLYNIEHMMQEANSAASFEQYFRWATLDEMSEVCSQLIYLGLSDVAAIVQRALRVAFPNGLPASPEAKDEATDWNEQQECNLAELFNSLEELNGRVMNVLGEYVLRVGA